MLNNNPIGGSVAFAMAGAGPAREGQAAPPGPRAEGPGQNPELKKMLEFMVGFAAGLMVSQAGQQGGLQSLNQNPGFGGNGAIGGGRPLNLAGANLNLGGGNPLGSPGSGGPLGNLGGRSPLGNLGGGSPLGNLGGRSPLGNLGGGSPLAGNGPPQGQGAQGPQAIIAVGIAIGMASARQGQEGGQPPGGGLNLAGANINLTPGGNGDFGRSLGAQHPGGINMAGSNVTMGSADFAGLLGSTNGPVNMAGANINMVGGNQGAQGNQGQDPQALLAVGIAIGKTLAQQGGGQNNAVNQGPGAFAMAGAFQTGMRGVIG